METSNGNWQAPEQPTYDINYTAILNCIKNIGPNPFPSQLRSGRIVYYTSIPSTIDTSSWPPTDLNQRFWKDYIDYVLGVMDNRRRHLAVINDNSNRTWQRLRRRLSPGARSRSRQKQLRKPAAQRPVHVLWRQSAAAAAALLVRPADDGRFPGQLQLLVRRQPELLAILLVAGHLPRSRRCTPASWAFRRR